MKRKRLWCFSLSALVCPHKVPTLTMDVYHEKQVKELCALHALNNLFQNSSSFTKQELDSICYSLSPNNFVNPHKSILGLGNYDINVIMAALQEKGFETIWFDKRKDPSCLNLPEIEGFILNIPTEYRFGFLRLPIHRKHWITIREVNGLFYNLDSKLDRPELIGKDAEAVLFLREQIQSHEREIFVIVKKEVDQKQTWRKVEDCGEPISLPSASNNSIQNGNSCENAANKSNNFTNLKHECVEPDRTS